MNRLSSNHPPLLPVTATPRSVYMILPPTVLLLDMAGPLEVLRIAKRFGADFHIHIVAPTATVKTSLAISIADVAPLPECLNSGDLIIVPGVLDEATTYQTAAARAIVDFLQHVLDPDQHEIMGICSGAFLLGQAGLLNQRACTTHHLLLDELNATFPQAKVRENRVFVEDGSLLTSAGITAGIDVTLYWLAQRYGTQIAQSTARHMNIYFRRTHNDPELSPWLIGRNHIHPAIHRVQDMIAADPTQAYSLDHLAKAVFISPRHLSRLFKQHTDLTVYDYHLNLKHALFTQWRAAGYNQEKAALAAGFSSAQAWRRSCQRKIN